MTQNLETADRIVRIVLAVTTVVIYSIGLIQGPFAFVLFLLGWLSLVIIVVRWLTGRFS